VDIALQPHQGILRRLLKGRGDAPILRVSPQIRRLVPSTESWIDLLSDIDLARVTDWCEHLPEWTKARIQQQEPCLVHARTILLAFRLERLHNDHELVEVQSNNSDSGSELGEVSIGKAFDAVIQSALNLESEHRKEFDVDLMAIAGLEEGMFHTESTEGSGEITHIGGWGELAGEHQDQWNPEDDIPDDWKRPRRAQKVGILHCDPELANGDLNSRGKGNEETRERYKRTRTRSCTLCRYPTYGLYCWRGSVTRRVEYIST
jgi:hypothetical protein